MTITKERLIELVRKAGGDVDHDDVHFYGLGSPDLIHFAQLIRNEALEEVAQIDLYALIRDEGRVAKADAEYIAEKITTTLEAMKEQL